MSAIVASIAPVEAIVRLARTYPVFPCRVRAETIYIRGKPKLRKPKSPHTFRGLDDASQDPDQIRAWWQEWPDALVGVPTGSGTRLAVVDYDLPKADQAARDWLELHAAELSGTRNHGTLSGGKHYLFRTPEGREYRNGVCLKLDNIERKGLDCRAQRGYIIWWPMHGGRVDGDEIAPLPAGLIDEQFIDVRNLKPLPTATPETWAKDKNTLILTLPYIDPTSYQIWIDTGQIIHLASGAADDGFLLWNAWSAGEITGECPAEYSGINDCREKWATFNPTAKARKHTKTVGSVVHAAKTMGFAWPSPTPKPQIDTASDSGDVFAEQLENPPAIETPPIDSYLDADEVGFTDTDIANSRRFAFQYGDKVRYTVERGWFTWDLQRWRVDEKGIQVQEFGKRTAISIFDEIRNAIDRKEVIKHAKNSQSKRAVEAMVSLARSERGIPARLADFDQDPWLFNVANGTIDLRSGELRDHSKIDLISSISEAHFDDNAKCPLWNEFLDTITASNIELRSYLQRLVGYLLVGDTSDQSLHFLYGSGANGKSVFCEVVQRLLGEYAITISPDVIMLRRHAGIPNDIARLRGVRAAMMNETTQGSKFDEAKLKDLTGGDTLTARFLNHEFFDFRPTHRIIVRGNHKPSINGTDDGIWRRLRLVPFTVSIPAEQQDSGLIGKLCGELSGILNWALDGCEAWREDGALKPPAIITDAVKQYRSESDTLGIFVEENCTVRANSQVKSSIFYSRYREFTEASNERAIPQKEMRTEMEKRGYVYRRGSGGNPIYEGLSLNTSKSDEDDDRRYGN